MRFKLERSTWEHFARWAYAGYLMHGRCAIVMDTPQMVRPKPDPGEPAQPADMLAIDCEMPPDWLPAIAGYDPEVEIVLLGGSTVFVLRSDGCTPRQLYDTHLTVVQV